MAVIIVAQSLHLRLWSILTKDKSISIKDCRSRYGEFIHRHCVKSSCHTVRRDREPSRIPVKRLTRVLKKKEENKEASWKTHYQECTALISSSDIYITFRSARPAVDYSCTPISADLHIEKSDFSLSHLAVASRRRNRKTTDLKFKLTCKGNCRFPKAVSKDISTESRVYKNLNHRVNYCQSSLCKDIEKKSRPCFCCSLSNTSCTILSRLCCSVWSKCWTAMCSHVFL